MKNMRKFAAQQLSKKEMNNVKGGLVYCSLIDENGDFIENPETGDSASGYADMTAEEAMARLNAIYGQFGWVSICG